MVVRLRSLLEDAGPVGKGESNGFYAPVCGPGEHGTGWGARCTEGEADAEEKGPGSTA